MRVVWTARAVTRLQDIHRFLQQRAPAYADSVVEKLLQRIDALAATPRLGRRLTEFAGDEVREAMERPFRIIYRLNGDLLEVLTVKHYRQRLIQAPDFEE